ncbi:DUF3144 domain-containing protein [Asticcacaulis sp. ZE23SCel15]|uniref:DUF3144 domain-containing protein n=1 Tax=Asticcacaulis sp. ZE23SCel15 TaxID=3059027 RepID=UPI00265E3D36|nr:DUF3144 domain-containing protein [Asticcacaulis sp. ZE23SCel15]WKL57853.1 DUF3144 domain-containing protein [Asticcacaulis sp. ZE23SCel15]
MSDNNQELFVKMASGHIDLANAHSKDADYELVAIALSHAAARYNAFMVSQSLPSEQMTAERDKHIDHLVGQFREFLTQHYDGYVQEKTGA